MPGRAGRRGPELRAARRESTPAADRAVELPASMAGCAARPPHERAEDGCARRCRHVDAPEQRHKRLGSRRLRPRLDPMLLGTTANHPQPPTGCSQTADGLNVARCASSTASTPVVLTWRSTARKGSAVPLQSGTAQASCSLGDLCRLMFPRPSGPVAAGAAHDGTLLRTGQQALGDGRLGHLGHAVDEAAQVLAVG